MVKNPGKTIYSGRRRTTTRSSGFNSHPDFTGGEFTIVDVPTICVEPTSPIIITFVIPPHEEGKFVGFGGWYNADSNISVEILTDQFSNKTLVPPAEPNWSKLGSLAESQGSDKSTETKVVFRSTKKKRIALYKFECGIIEHKHLEWAKRKRPVLLENMYAFAPEANFISEAGKNIFECEEDGAQTIPLYLKSCNRCARFLPINIDDERIHLGFSNHCTAEHTRPCSHTGFGKLHNAETGKTLQLEYGYQLECRYCKKYEVNAAHNPQKTAAQTKEDAARRRSLELLLTELYGESPQLRYRHITGKGELADDVWLKFSGKCFNCQAPISDKKKMHLDHTRPLAMLWPLDSTATCLCGSCNSQKRDRFPADYYSVDQLQRLSKITGIPIEELQNPSPNMKAIYLLKDRLEWFFNEFCLRPELNKVRDGKLSSAVLVKALQKTLDQCADEVPINLVKLHEDWLGSRQA